MKPLLFATHNLGKVRELQRLVGPMEVRSLRDYPHLATVVEDGATFEANAQKKAQAAASATGMPALADDSGLCVDALNGAPGVLSARYALGNDQDRVQALLTAMKAIPVGQRGALFRCALYLALPSGSGTLETGECRGVIAPESLGGDGFGYDSIFLIPELGKTFGELTLEEKNTRSHRAEAFGKMRTHLERLLQ